MTKKQIEQVIHHRDAILRICSNVRSCRKCPLSLEYYSGRNCAGRTLAATYLKEKQRKPHFERKQNYV